MKSFKIPIGLVTYTVKFRKKIVYQGKECEGLCDPNAKILWIEKRDDPNVMLASFWHEYGHALFNELGHEELQYNEPFIEGFAQNLARVKLPEFK